MDFNPAYGMEPPGALPIGSSQVEQSTTNDYEPVSRQTTMARDNDKPPLPLRRELTAVSDKKQTKYCTVLVCCASFAVCLVLALLVAVTVLLCLEFLANRSLMAELSEVRKFTQDFAKSKLLYHNIKYMCIYLYYAWYFGT